MSFQNSCISQGPYSLFNQESTGYSSSPFPAFSPQNVLFWVFHMTTMWYLAVSFKMYCHRFLDSKSATQPAEILNTIDFVTYSCQRISATSWSLLIIVQPLIYLPGSFCPSPILPTPGQPCNQLPGALDCSYENHIDYHGLAGNCCCGQCDVDMTCAPDSTSGSGLWQPKHPMLCPTKGCGSEGEWWRDNLKQFDPFLKVNLINC